MLPFLAANRRQGSPDKYACEPCMKAYTAEHRRYMKCGWLPTRQLLAPRGNVGAVGGFPGLPETCPGFTAQLPQVLEVARAWAWWERGQLELRAPDPAPRLLDLIEQFNGAVVGANDWTLEEIKRKAGRD